MVVDTMVICYALLNVKHFGEIALEVVEKSDEIIAPDIIRPEIANVIWKWVEWASLPLERGLAVLEDADCLIDEIIPTDYLWYQALELSKENNHPVYDTLFVALARFRKTKVISQDKSLKEKFSGDVLLMQEFLGK